MNLNVVTAQDATAAVVAVKADASPPREIADEAVVTTSGAAPQVTADDLYGRLLKYIPAPLIGVYLFVTSAVYAAADEGDQPSAVLLWIVLAFFLVATVAWLKTRDVHRPAQIAVSVLAFTAFAATSPGPFQLIDGWDALYGTLAITATAVVLVIFRPGPLPADDAGRSDPPDAPQPP